VALAIGFLSAGRFDHHQPVGIGILPGFTRAWSVLQPSQPLTDKPLAPHANTSPAQAYFLANGPVGFPTGSTEHQASTLNLPVRGGP